MHRTLPLLIIILLTSHLSSNQAQTKSAKAVNVFDVQQNADTIFIRPVVMFDRGEFKFPYSSMQGESARRRFVDKYFAPGKTYILIFGGGNAGFLKIKQGYWQDGAYAYGELNEDEPGRIHGQLHALATDYDTSARGSAWRRPPTEQERAAAIEVARAAYVEHNVPIKALEAIEVNNLTAIDIDGDNKAELVGSFKVPQLDHDKISKDKPPRFLFVIAEGEGEHYKAARVNYQFNPKQSEYPLGSEMLCDNVDIDGDGVNEIVTSFTGPAYKDFYLVYQRKAGKWNQVFSSAGMQ